MTTTLDTDEAIEFALLTSSNFGFKAFGYDIPDRLLTNEEYREVHGDCHHEDVEVIDEQDDHGNVWHVWVCRDCKKYDEALSLPIWEEVA